MFTSNDDMSFGNNSIDRKHHADFPADDNLFGIRNTSDNGNRKVAQDNWQISRKEIIQQLNITFPQKPRVIFELRNKSSGPIFSKIQVESTSSISANELIVAILQNMREYGFLQEEAAFQQAASAEMARLQARREVRGNELIDAILQNMNRHGASKEERIAFKTIAHEAMATLHRLHAIMDRMIWSSYAYKRLNPQQCTQIREFVDTLIPTKQAEAALAPDILELAFTMRWYTQERNRLSDAERTQLNHMFETSKIGNRETFIRILVPHYAKPSFDVFREVGFVDFQKAVPSVCILIPTIYYREEQLGRVFEFLENTGHLPKDLIATIRNECIFREQSQEEKTLYQALSGVGEYNFDALLKSCEKLDNQFSSVLIMHYPEGYYNHKQRNIGDATLCLAEMCVEKGLLKEAKNALQLISENKKSSYAKRAEVLLWDLNFYTHETLGKDSELQEKLKVSLNELYDFIMSMSKPNDGLVELLIKKLMRFSGLESFKNGYTGENNIQVKLQEFIIKLADACYKLRAIQTTIGNSKTVTSTTGSVPSSTSVTGATRSTIDEMDERYDGLGADNFIHFLIASKKIISNSISNSTLDLANACLRKGLRKEAKRAFESVLEETYSPSRSEARREAIIKLGHLLVSESQRSTHDDKLYHEHLRETIKKLFTLQEYWGFSQTQLLIQEIAVFADAGSVIMDIDCDDNDKLKPLLKLAITLYNTLDKHRKAHNIQQASPALSSNSGTSFLLSQSALAAASAASASILPSSMEVTDETSRTSTSLLLSPNAPAAAPSANPNKRTTRPQSNPANPENPENFVISASPNNRTRPQSNRTNQGLKKRKIHYTSA